MSAHSQIQTQPPEKKQFNLEDVRNQYFARYQDAEMIIGLTNALEEASRQITALRKENDALKSKVGDSDPKI
jgi:L-lactate utilization protein LutC